MVKKNNKKGFVEKYQNMIIVVAIIIAVLFLFTNNLIPGLAFNITQPTTTNTTNQYYTPPTYDSEAQLPVTDEVDLRLVFAPYAATDAYVTCIALGGEWVFERDHVGCIGAGPINCSDPLITAAGVQCIGAGGDWVCGIDNLYCIK